MATTAPTRVTDLARRHRLDINTVADPGTGYAQLLAIKEAKLIEERRTVDDEHYEDKGAMRKEVTGYGWRIEVKIGLSLNAAGTSRDAVHAFLRTKWHETRTKAAAQSEFGIQWYDRNGIADEAHEGRVYVESWTPDGGTGQEDVTLVLQGQGQITGIVNPASSQLPGVTSLSPATGPAAGGTLVSIFGHHFTGVTGATGVKFGANNATSYKLIHDGRIEAVAPAGLAGTVQVIVTTPVGASPNVAADDYLYV